MVQIEVSKFIAFTSSEREKKKIFFKQKTDKCLHFEPTRSSFLVGKRVFGKLYKEMLLTYCIYDRTALY